VRNFRAISNRTSGGGVSAPWREWRWSRTVFRSRGYRTEVRCEQPAQIRERSAIRVASKFHPPSVRVEHALIYRNGFPGCGKFIGGRILWIAPNCVNSGSKKDVATVRTDALTLIEARLVGSKEYV
jgi:hypothetical protein